VIAGSLTSPRLAGDGGAGRWDLDDAEYLPKLQV
jgi:hypothetical protein